MTKNEIIEIIFESLEEISQEYDVKLPKELSTKLFGGECELDSLGLVSLIVSIEENINNSNSNNNNVESLSSSFKFFCSKLIRFISFEMYTL